MKTDSFWDLENYYSYDPTPDSWYAKYDNPKLGPALKSGLYPDGRVRIYPRKRNNKPSELDSFWDSIPDSDPIPDSYYKNDPKIGPALKSKDKFNPRHPQKTGPFVWNPKPAEVSGKKWLVKMAMEQAPQIDQLKKNIVYDLTDRAPGNSKGIHFVDYEKGTDWSHKRYLFDLEKKIEEDKKKKLKFYNDSEGGYGDMVMGAKDLGHTLFKRLKGNVSQKRVYRKSNKKKTKTKLRGKSRRSSRRRTSTKQKRRRR